MNQDDDLCLCFHVTKRKVIQHIRVHRPRVASQLSECFGAGTGCGWCRPFLQRLLDEAEPDNVALPGAAQYASRRQRYRDEQQGQRDSNS